MSGDGVTDSPGLTDIHAHPAMNAFLWDRDLRRHYLSGRAFNPLASLSDFPMLKKGGVRVLWSSLHVPERDFFKCGLIRFAARFTRGGRKLLKLSAWECLIAMMDEMEAQVARAPEQFAIARSNSELDRVLARGLTAVVHTVEGAHVLGAGLVAGDLAGRLRRLDELARRGVASLTLAHLFPNEVAGHSEGIPESQRKFPICPLRTEVDETRGLTPTGTDIVERMVELRIVPDLTHCTPVARKEVLRLVDRRIPVISSHTGLQSLNPVPYNLEDREVIEIAATGGVIGVIFMPYWLRRDHPRAGLDAIWQTMNAIHTLTGNWKSVAIGTDFDGFTDPPDDVANASKLPAVEKMLREKGVGPGDLEGILGGNARRVLRQAWNP